MSRLARFRFLAVLGLLKPDALRHARQAPPN